MQDPFEIDIETGIIDLIEEKKHYLLFSIFIKFDSFYFQGILYLNDNKNHILEVDESFLKLFGKKETKELPFYNELVADIIINIGDLFYT